MEGRAPVAGLVAGWVARRGDAGVYAVCAALLILFVPEHVRLWSRFPVWYHATFLASLLVAPWIGRRLLGRRAFDAQTQPALADGGRDLGVR